MRTTLGMPDAGLLNKGDRYAEPVPDSRNSGAAAAGRGHPEAIVRPKSAQQAFTVERVPVDAELAEFVDYYWYVGWDVPTPYRQQVVPQPRVHMAAEHHELVDERAEEAGPRLLAHGINREYFYRTLTGVGHTLGAAFHPGGFRPFLGASVGSISGTVRPAVRILGVDDRPAAARILSAT
ncbi:MAG: DUF6597 domain-containing transcriptional factor, partial [Nocardioidaceae bacterium]